MSHVMPHMTYLEAAVVGLVQGVTELFPVSSLGHNVLIPALIGGSWATDLNVAAQESPYLAFIVGLHVATAIALLIYFWRDWVRIVGGFFSSIRDHPDNEHPFAGPRFLMRIAELEMHPADTADRREIAQDDFGLGYCNITKCCTEVCPENIKITDNALIPMKERVVGRKYDPIVWLGSKITRRPRGAHDTPEVPAKS